MIPHARRCGNASHVCAAARLSALGIVPRVSRVGRRVCELSGVRSTGPRVQVPAVVRAMAIPALKAMLASGTEAENGVHNSMGALRAICAAPEGRDAAVAAGVPAAVTVAMATCNAGARRKAAFALSNM